MTCGAIYTSSEGNRILIHLNIPKSCAVVTRLATLPQWSMTSGTAHFCMKPVDIRIPPQVRNDQIRPQDLLATSDHQPSATSASSATGGRPGTHPTGGTQRVVPIEDHRRGPILSSEARGARREALRGAAVPRRSALKSRLGAVVKMAVDDGQ